MEEGREGRFPHHMRKGRFTVTACPTLGLSYGRTQCRPVARLGQPGHCPGAPGQGGPPNEDGSVCRLPLPQLTDDSESDYD
ncbi:hypothetical protein J6590_076261 [Homalodisca vitripennis]|nr:hypothetical protein J6590_076261 [Homalodisca vitripennis]